MTFPSLSLILQRFMWQRILLLVADGLLCLMALHMAYLLRHDFELSTLYHNQFLLAATIAIPLQLLVFWQFDLYRGILRYAGLRELLAIVLAVIVTSFIFLLLNGILPTLGTAPSWLPSLEKGRAERVSLNILVTSSLLTIMLTGGMRLSRRLLLMSPVRKKTDPDHRRRVLIIGAGDAGEAVCRQMLNSLAAEHEPIGFLDDDPSKIGRQLHGRPILGTLGTLPDVLPSQSVDEVVVAIPRVNPSVLRRIVQGCEHARVTLRLLPNYSDVMSGRISISHIRPVEIEDLLGRPAIQLELPSDQNYIGGKTVLVSGAGGSIGSELVRQALQLNAHKVILLGHGENSIYEIQMELAARYGPRIQPVIADVRDHDKLQRVLQVHKPQVIFHAAAHKHVPLMEGDPDEAVRNNIQGTRNLAHLAQAHHVQRFILISSDKAVRPTNVMGATKRVAEMIIFQLAQRQPQGTQFVAVRFGNVLGSRGSVVPLFKKQIAQGGPITITHPEVTRFFMTIPEAVSLVIQAGSMKEQGRLFLLDMGQPVPIIDLARNLIRLSGYEPDVDIPIKFTGLRPGEKLYEELLTADEGVRATPLGKIFMTEPDQPDEKILEDYVNRLITAADQLDGGQIRALLKQIVPDYRPAV
jgi:FlaA1/EpsC-like NDP-sugar epimerase